MMHGTVFTPKLKYLSKGKPFVETTTGDSEDLIHNNINGFITELKNESILNKKSHY